MPPMKGERLFPASDYCRCQRPTLDAWSKGESQGDLCRQLSLVGNLGSLRMAELSQGHLGESGLWGRPPGFG